MVDHLKITRKHEFQLNRFDDDSHFKSIFLKYRKKTTKRKKTNAASVIRNSFLDRNQFIRDLIPKSNHWNFERLPKHFYAQQIQDAITTVSIPGLLPRMRHKMHHQLLNRYSKKYAKTINEYLADAEAHYIEKIREFHLKQFAALIGDQSSKDVIPTFKFKHSGRTVYHKQFLRNQKLLKGNLFIPYPFIRFILHSSNQHFPSVLNDYSAYRRNKSGICIWLELMEFETMAQRDLENNSIFLREEWYPKVIQVLLKHFRKRLFPVQQWFRMLNCAKGLINRQITTLKIDTFEHIFNVFKKRSTMPTIKFQAVCTNGRIELQPNFKELLSSFKRIFRNIAAVATKFPPLEPMIDRFTFLTKETYLRNEIEEVTLNQMMNKLEVELKVAYTPVLEYIESIEVEYHDLLSDEIREDLDTFLNEPRHIDEYFDKITEFRNYIEKIQQTVHTCIFDNAMVNQNKALVGLRTIAQDYIDEITEKIANGHRNECQKICDWFASVQQRASEAPKSTETLLENGEFMLLMKNKKIDEIRTHIQANLKVSGRLLDLAELSEEHFNLQISTIHWLHNIQEIFEQNSSQFELYKNKFEEHLVAVTKKLTQDIDDLIPKLAIIDDMYDTKKLHDYHATLEDYLEQIKCFADYIKWINKEEKLFKLPVSQYPIVESLEDYVKPFAALIKLCIEWLRYYYIWMDGPFEYLDAGIIENFVQNYMKEFETTQKYYRNRIKADMLGDPVLKFRGQTEDPDPEKHPVPLRLCNNMINWINGFQIGVSIVKIMCNPALRDRHWAEMSSIAGFDLTPDAGTSLRKITKYGIDHLLPSFEIISIGANKELKLQMDLANMIEQWQSIDFPFDAYKQSEIIILGNIEDIQVLLDDHTIKTLSMRGSAFVTPCEHEVRQWYEKLLRTTQIFDEWMRLQGGWLHLLPILSSKDISAEMPSEEKLFNEVNDIYCKYIQMAMSETNIMKMMSTDHLLEDLIAANEMLEKTKDGVYAYLDKKRLYFARFFFLSNNELLQILAEAKHPENIQSFLCKCFRGIWRIEINNGETIDGMMSRMSEKIPFTKPVSMAEFGASVEKWLLGVENEMQSAVRNEIINCYADYLTSNRIDWALSWPQMVILVVANIFWTSDIHAALLNQNRDLLMNILNEIDKNLNEITTIMRTQELTHLNRIVLKTLCIFDVNARDVTKKLIDDRNCDVDCFQWISQLRYYWINNEINVRALNSTISYGNEYLGNFQRNVMTPLTERCFLCVLLAFQHQMGASIEGPTATGKSETIKDLAKALAVQMKIFDCTPDFYFRTISQFLKGVASSGAWLCFEDFNRIDVKTLSVVAQQMRIVQLAVRKKVPKFLFDGTEIKIKSNCNIVIMSNPSTNRSQLPDNLKVLFRPITMVLPDVKQITEVSLYAAGFQNAKSFANQITEFYRICKEFLPPQPHYDFGLRCIKISLRVCASRLISRASDESDEHIIYNSLLDVNRPRINAEHLNTFQSIIDDIFPNAKCRFKNYNWIRDIFDKMCIEKNCVPIETQYKKLLEAYESIEYRPGLLLVGNPYTGKTFILQMLAMVMAQQKCIDLNDIEIAFINPKAIELKHLFDDIVSSLFRQTGPDNHNFKWIVFDGPIYSDWAENLNTVLDDNRKLCLSSGEILHLMDNMTFIFEVHDLSQASPSTISRLGIVHFESNTLDWSSMAKSWMNGCNKTWMAECKSFLWDMFEWILPLVIDYVNKHGQNLMNPLQYNLLNTTFNIIQMVMDDVIESNSDDYQKFLISWMQAAMIYGVAWGIGGILNEESRKAFDQFHRKIWSCGDEFPPPNCIRNRIDISLPNEGCLNDYCYVFKQKGTWKLWIDIVRRQEPELDQHGVFVATADTARYSHLIEMHIKHKKNLLLIGPSASGKTRIMQNILQNRIDKTKVISATITFNLKTNGRSVHEDILSNLIKLRRGVYGPPNGKNCSFFIDNLNISDSSHEVIRQIFDYGFIYDLKSTSKIYLENILMLAACGSPGGRNRNIDLRFLNHFNCFSINECSEETLTRIFSGVLMSGYKKSGHAADVTGSVNQMVSASMQLFEQIIVKLKPTPNKSHYCFNMRDVLRVCVGCSMLRKETVENKKIFAKIWFHEMLREFHDRLFDMDEKVWLYERITEQINDTCGIFKDSMEIVFENHVNDDGIVTMDSIRNLMFGSYLDSETEATNRKYEEIANLNKLADLSNAIIKEYSERENLNVILFNYALEHLNRICRIISMPGGNGLIIGYVDSGRKTLARLATIVCKQKWFDLRIEQNYNVAAWKEDIKHALKSAGGLNQQTVLFLSENQLTNDIFLTDVEYLLNLGDVPNLWPIDEKQELLEMVRLVAQGGNRNIDISADEVFSFFINRCHQNLHIIISLHSIGAKMRNFFRLHPSLVNCCTIDVFDQWPDDALEMVATKFLANFAFSEELSNSLGSAFKYVHATADDTVNTYRIETGNSVYVTPSSYLEFVRSYAILLDEKRNEISHAKSKYINGLDTLEQAAKAVENMQIELNDLEPKLRAMAENCRLMTKEIELKTLEASAATEQVKRDELIANQQAAAALEMEDECSKDLAQAVPVLEDALQALNTLKPADITLVKSMKNPPSAVKLVMAAVCVMKGVPPDRINDAASGKKIIDYWGPSKRILGDIGFLQSLKDYDKDDISPDIMKKIRKDFIPHKDFQPHIVAKASSAAEGLCKWIKAIENFESVNTVVRPKKFKLMRAKKNLKQTRKYLAEKRALAAELDAKVFGLNEELEKTNDEKKRTEEEVAMCEQKLRRAEALIDSLGQEKGRWTEKALHLQRLFDYSAGDILISSGLIAYLGALPKPYRDQCTSTWHKFIKLNNIPCSDTFNLTTCLGNEDQIRQWNTNGLPLDKSSIENVILLTKSRRQCLFIDPEMRANKWIKRIERVNRLKVIKQSDPTYFGELLKCMEHGQSILIEDIAEPLNVCLDPILAYRFSGQCETLQIHSKLCINVSSNFRLYLTSNARNLNFTTSNTGKMNIINFIFTLNGLEETLLDILVLKENPYLREERDQLLQNKLDDKLKRMQYEDAILTAISECEGDILEDETAIKKMEASRHLYIEVINKQAVYIEAEQNIEIFRENYRNVSSYAAVLYSCLDHLRHINPMYEYSLDWYLSLYNDSIEKANRSVDLNRRIDFLLKSITKNVYQSICRSIFDADKLLFSWIIITNMLLHDDRLKIEQLHFFNGKKIVLPLPEKYRCDWISDELWYELNNLAAVIEFENFLPSIAEYSEQWRCYYDNADNGIPMELRTEFSSFEQLLISKVFHPENLTFNCTEFIAKEAGEQFVNPPSFDIHKSFEESNILTPLILILSPGVDPTETLWHFAEKMGYSQSMQMISLGADQGTFIEDALLKAQKQGLWICLQNCHINTEWLINVEKLWKNMDLSNTSLSFRLWMTSEPTEHFPLNLLQNGIKITYEKAKGLKAGLLHSYQTNPLKSNFYDSCPEQDKIFKKLLYSLTFFDIVVNERQHYGNVGWNVAYEFTQFDFIQSIQQLQMFLNSGKRLSFNALQYIIGECAYGGRVIDEFDKRLLKTILVGMFNENVLTDSSFKLALNDGCTFPRRLEYRMVIKFIEETIPTVSNCEIYGLHSNSKFSFDQTNSNRFLVLIKVVNDPARGSNIEDFDKMAKDLKEILEKLPQRVEVDGGFVCDNGMATVLASEIKQYNQLWDVISNTCCQLLQVIEGNQSMTSTLEEVFISISKNEIPKQWIQISYPSRKTFASYLNDFCARYKWFSDWHRSNQIQISFWFSAFFQPKSLLAAIKLNFSREHKIPLETLAFDFDVMNERSNNEPECGVYIHGLYLKAAHWNGTAIDEQLYAKSLEEFPTIHIKPILAKQLDVSKRYECPVYYTSGQRTVKHQTEAFCGNSILSIFLPFNENLPLCHWIKRGIMLICENEE